ncbi:hypothetical protein ACTXT7_017203 [Hymenolepis weldensis]
MRLVKFGGHGLTRYARVIPCTQLFQNALLSTPFMLFKEMSTCKHKLQTRQFIRAADNPPKVLSHLHSTMKWQDKEYLNVKLKSVAAELMTDIVVPTHSQLVNESILSRTRYGQCPYCRADFLGQSNSLPDRYLPHPTPPHPIPPLSPPPPPPLPTSPLLPNHFTSTQTSLGVFDNILTAFANSAFHPSTLP